MPLPYLGGSEIPKINHWQTINDPYTNQKYLAIPAIRPDWAILHVQQADILGNARIFGSKFEDVILSRAAQHIVITCEELLPEHSLTDLPETTDIPGFLVDAVVYAPRGAWPTSCYQHYSVDEKAIRAICKLTDEEQLLKWLDKLSSPPASPLLDTPLAKEHLSKEGKR